MNQQEKDEVLGTFASIVVIVSFVLAIFALLFAFGWATARG